MAKTGCGGLAHSIFIDVKRQNDIALGRNLWCDFKLQIGFSEGDGSSTTRRRDLVGQFGSLLDQSLDLIRRHDPRTGNHTPFAISFKGR